MIYACTRRKADGLLTGVQSSPGMPDPVAPINNAIIAFGGIFSDWELVELSQADYDTIIAALPGRSFIIADELSSKSAPTIGADKTQIEDDGVDVATVTFNVGDVDYIGDVTWKVNDPEGEIITETEAMVAGVATLAITTTLIGTITVQAETVAHGVGLIEIEGM